MRPYNVPVWFTVDAENADDAFGKVELLMYNLEMCGELPVWLMGEAMEEVPPEFSDYIPPEE